MSQLCTYSKTVHCTLVIDSSKAASVTRGLNGQYVIVIVIENGRIWRYCRRGKLLPRLDEKLTNAEHGGEEDSMVQHPLDVGVEGDWRTPKSPDGDFRKLVALQSRYY